MTKKETICPNCGAPISDGAKFCTNCGSKSEKTKKPIYKQWWLWVIVAIVLLGAIGAGGERDSVKEADIPTSAVQDEQSLPTEATDAQTPPTETPKQEDPVNTDKSQAEKDEQKQAALTIMRVQFDQILSENFGENYTLEINDTSTTVNIWSDGVAAGAALAASGDPTTMSAWNTMLDSFSEMSKSISAIPVALEFDDNYYCCINLLNDLNKDNVLASIVNGVVIYDVVSASN